MGGVAILGIFTKSQATFKNKANDKDDNDDEEELRQRGEGGGLWGSVSTYLIVDSTLHGGVFITNFGFLIFPSLSDYFPPGELIRTLASEK